jgi:hypothetical protein
MKQTKIRWAKYVVCTTEEAWKVSVAKPDGKRSLGIPCRKYENVKMNIKKTGCNGIDWIHVSQNRNQCGVV